MKQRGNAKLSREFISSYIVLSKRWQFSRIINTDLLIIDIKYTERKMSIPLKKEKGSAFYRAATNISISPNFVKV